MSVPWELLGIRGFLQVLSECAWSFQTLGPSFWRQGGSHSPTPTGGRWEVVRCVWKGREWEIGDLGLGVRLLCEGLRGGHLLPCSRPGPHPAPRGFNMEVYSVWLPLPFPLGVFSEQTTSLQGFTRDPPHPQLGGSLHLLPSLGR